MTVAPLAGAGIEMLISTRIISPPFPSPLSQGRELKFRRRSCTACTDPVAPLAGAGIEIRSHHRFTTPGLVAPLAGAGIEMEILS